MSGLRARWSARLGTRGSIVARAGSWSLTAKAVAAANLFLALPFVLNALGPAQFGVWATLVSVVTFAGFLDFGIGNGAMNMIADAHGRGSEGEVRDVIREATSVLARIGSLVLVTTCICAWLPWWRLLGLSPAMAGDARASSIIVFVCVAFAIPLNLATRIQLGLGRGYIAFRWQAAGQFIALLATIALSLAHAGLPWIVAASLSSSVLPALGNSLMLWRDPVHGIRGLLPSPARDSIRRRIWRDGSQFFVLQLAGALAFAADLPLVTSFLGPEVAGSFAIVQRLFSLIPLGLSLVWVPLWPVYRHAIASGDEPWVRRTLARTTVTAMAAALVGAVLFAMLFTPISQLWVHRAVPASALLLGGFVAWVTLEAGGQSMATYLNAAGVLRFQVRVSIVLALLSLGLKCVVLGYGNSDAVPWMTLAAYVVASVIPTLMYLPSLMRHASRRQPYFTQK
jgi:O-antigen/teichoic acid export membrane protein